MVSNPNEPDFKNVLHELGARSKKGGQDRRLKQGTSLSWYAITSP